MHFSPEESRRLEKLRRDVIVDRLEAQGHPVTNATIEQILRQIDRDIAIRAVRCDTKQSFIQPQPLKKELGTPTLQQSQQVRRRYTRWYLPWYAITGEIHCKRGSAACHVLDASMGGFACELHNPMSVSPDERVTLTLGTHGIEIEAYVRNAGNKRIGAELICHEPHAHLLAIVKEHGVCARPASHGVVVEGHLGFQTLAAIRACGQSHTLDLSMVTSIDPQGIGAVLLYLERGGMVRGCRGQVRKYMQIAKVCGKQCVCPQANGEPHVLR